MEIFLVLLLVEFVLAAPAENFDVEGEHYGNPDEWGPYYQGDMRFAEGLTRNGKLGGHWPDGTVIYVISSTFSSGDKQTLERWMTRLSDDSDGCIEFIERTNENDYIYITNANDGCWSYVGKIGGQQRLNLQQPGCFYKGIAQHELLHALGFFHEQSRTDRDNFVRIKENNIISGYENNFDKLSADETYGVAYDYGSVMHYSKKAFSRNGRPTIVPIPDRTVKIGQRRGPSDSDIVKLKRRYGCPAK